MENQSNKVVAVNPKGREPDVTWLPSLERARELQGRAKRRIPSEVIAGLEGFLRMVWCKGIVLHIP